MSKIVWDATGERFYEIGVKRGVLYPWVPASGSTPGAYGAGVAWNGLTTVTESPSGAEPNDLWADNIKYATLRSAETFGGTIEAYTYPKEFEACQGFKDVSATSTGLGVYVAQQSRLPFAFSYVTNIGDDTETDVENDNNYKLHIVYGATVNPTERSYATINDSPDAMQMSWEFVTTPIVLSTEGFKPVAHIVIDSRYANATKLQTLEDQLYGGDNTDPTLVMPDAIIAAFRAT